MSAVNKNSSMITLHFSLLLGKEKKGFGIQISLLSWHYPQETWYIFPLFYLHLSFTIVHSQTKVIWILSSIELIIPYNTVKWWNRLKLCHDIGTIVELLTMLWVSDNIIINVLTVQFRYCTYKIMFKHIWNASWSWPQMHSRTYPNVILSLNRTIMVREGLLIHLISDHKILRQTQLAWGHELNFFPALDLFCCMLFVLRF